ncbi:MAG: hypothetical protein AAB403_15110 [Planctomycetota bacterium]
MKRKHIARVFALAATAWLAADVTARAGTNTTYVDNLVVTNTFSQTEPISTNYFLGKVGIGTNNPAARLHVAGEMKVDGAMTLPRQGDVEMGVYTNGASTNGASPGYLPSGTAGAMLYHNGTNWTSLTNLYWSSADKRLYFNSAAAGSHVATTGGQFYMGSNVISNVSDPTAAQDAATKNYVDGLRYADRGDPTAYDWTEATLIEDSSWRILSCSNIVPAGARAILFQIYARAPGAGYYLALRKNGNTNVYARALAFTQVAGAYVFSSGVVACDTNRAVQYYASSGLTNEGAVVCGWWY